MKSGRSADVAGRIACLAAAACLAGLPAAAVAAASASTLDRDDALAGSQAAIGRPLGSQVLIGTDGSPFALDSLRGRPLVVSMIYTSCSHICPLLTERLAETVDVAREALGEDSFSVVTVGFDWAVDTPEQMRLFAAEHRIDMPNWYFLAGDAASINALSSALGFRFVPSAKGFDHLTQTTIVDAEGIVYRQVYGIDVDPQSVVEPLKELVYDTPRAAGFVAHWVDNFKLFCTVYDPSSGRYRFDYSIAMTLFVGILCLGAILTFVVREWRHAR